MKLLQYLCIPFLLVLTGCAGCGDDEALAFARTPYTGNQLRIDGYYYHEFFNKENYISTLFLYQNGILLDGDTFEVKGLAEKERQWQSSSWQQTVKKFKFYWGVFKIEGENFQYDHWHASERPLVTKLRSGKVLNDTTFIIYEDGREKIHRFKQFSPKPDSTNSYIP